jgi:hypothetical protein
MSENTVIIAFHCLNCSVFVTEAEYVYCAVRIEYLYVTKVNRIPHGRAMARAVVARLALHRPGFVPE